MDHRKIGNTLVSAVGIGTWAMAGNSWGNVEDATSIKAIRTAVDSGINLLDTAACYGGGHSEEVVGKALEGIRQKVFLCTKCGLRVMENDNVAYNLTPESIRFEVEASLKRLRTDHIDLYQFHYPDPNTPVAESLGEMEKLKEEGKIRYIGISNFSLEQVKDAAACGDIATVQLKYSLLSRENQQIVDFCRHNGIGVLTYGSIAGGMLSGKFDKPPVFAENDKRAAFYPFFTEPVFSKCKKLTETLKSIAAEHGYTTSGTAIAWVTSQPGITTALVGAKTPEQARANALAGSYTLSEKELCRIRDEYTRLFAS
jgi:aryl-alcohol dehydrogenase-like predicted oxidoreductase